MKIKFYLKFFHLFAEKERRTRISYSFNDKGGKTKRFRTRFARSTNYIPGASSAQARDASMADRRPHCAARIRAAVRRKDFTY
jgi:hypothetical protein